MSGTTCSRSGGAVLCAMYRLYSDRGFAIRVALQVAQIEFDLIANQVLPDRAHFLARLQMQKLSTAPAGAQRRS